ncbi:diacylglycerol kinase family protein [Flavitalea sp. BT771]|uniref:diacylglycerol/lipid kinase family protein n=1 Tax=Flavitalea sp. BT771 TaxID=3063329 RepID=UPI0026E22D7A|nr:diacylglycerol kinase family protein [Flavitalea sp. BT771]MDO6434359.1 diacylglycerol kinase family protein [Flavitalea sp. BT771]MDV6223259.1 diacylglycerol kinase family protein [Flavitalea sp. BT771]
MVARKIIFLINPISGTRGKSSLKELITRRTKERHIDFDILPTNAEGKYDLLPTLIEREKVTDVVICGGDGTINAVAATLQGNPVRVGIIPMGSGNGLAFAAKIPKDPSKALDIVFTGKASPIDGFMINESFSCMLCGIGFDAQVAHSFAQQPTRGLQTYVRVTLRHFFSGKCWPFEIDLPTEKLHAEAFFISIANANQFGNHFTIAPRARLDDGLLDIVIVKKMNKLHTLLSVLRQVMGSRPKNILYFQTPTLRIVNRDLAPLHIDGDPQATAPEFNIRILPKIIQLIQP